MRDSGMKKRFLTLLALALALLSMAGCGGKKPPAVSEAPPTAEPTAAPTPEPTPPPTVLGQTEDRGEDYIDRFVFLGDSTTYGMAYYDVLPHSQIWTPASGTLTISNWAVESIEYYDEQGNTQSLSIADAAAKRQPEYMLITLGLNGISFLDEAGFKEYYTSLVQAVQAASPGTKIICNSIYPVIGSEVSADIGNDRIRTANVWIQDVAAGTGTRYLNTHEALTDLNGDLRDEYCNGDGIHLTPKGFDVVLQTIRTHGYQ